jgi:hypothetical protein
MTARTDTKIYKNDLKQAVSRCVFLFTFAAYPEPAPTAIDAPIGANIEQFKEFFNNVPAVAPLHAIRGTAGTAPDYLLPACGPEKPGVAPVFPSGGWPGFS